MERLRHTAPGLYVAGLNIEIRWEGIPAVAQDVQIRGSGGGERGWEEVGKRDLFLLTEFLV